MAGQEQPRVSRSRSPEKAANINLNETKIEKLKTAIAELTEWQIGASCSIAPHKRQSVLGIKA